MVYGQTARDFFATLVARQLATVYHCAHRRARIFHIQHRALYTAIGEPHTRFRKPTPIGRAIERLMLLDAILASQHLEWLTTERDKLAHFTILLGTQLRREELPQLTFERAAIRPSGTSRTSCPLDWPRTDARTCSSTSSREPRRWTSARFCIATPSCCGRCRAGRFGS